MSQASDILRLIEAAITPLIEAEGGKLDTATDIDHVMQILRNSPERFRVIQAWEGYGDHPNSRHGMATSNFLVTLQQSTGLQKDPARSLHTSAHNSGDDSFLDLVEKISALYRALRFPGRGMDCDGFSLTDSQWVADTPSGTRALAMTFSIATSLPNISQTILIPAP